MEEIGATILKYQPLRDLWRSLYDYARRTIFSHPIRPFTRELGQINIPKLIEIGSAILLVQPYKCLSVTTKKITRQSFFLLSFFLSFSSHTVSWACGSFHEPRKFFQTLFYTFTCLSNNFSQIFISTSPMYALPVILLSI